MHKTNIFSEVILGMAFLLSLSCEKDAGTLGIDAIGEEPARAGVLSQFSVIAYSALEDSVLAVNPQRAIAGSYQDDVLGFSSSSFVTHLLLQSSQPDFGTDPQLDSVRMVLRYSGYYGDTNRPMSLQVRLLEEFMDPDADQAYYSSKQWKTGPLLGSSGPVPHRPMGIDTILSGQQVSRITFPLDTGFFKSAIFDELDAGNPAFESNTAFIDYFNGIEVSSAGGDGCMLYFETFTGQSRIELYYHNTTDTSVFYLETDNSGITANNFSHDYSTAAFDPALQDTSAGEAFTYVQAMGGVLTELQFPTLSALADSAFLITKAELVFHSEIGSDASGMWVPDQLLLLETGANDTGKVLIKDYRISASTGVGGNVLRGSFREKQYRFNITRHIFERLSEHGGIGTRLFLVAGSGASTANRVVLNGNLHPRNPLTLDIYFTTKP